MSAVFDFAKSPWDDCKASKCCACVPWPLIYTATFSNGPFLIIFYDYGIFNMHSLFYTFSGYPEQIEEGKQFITSIMGDFKPITDIDSMKNDKPNTSGMKILENVIDLEAGTRGNVVIRSITESFWHKVIEATKTHRVCALGTRVY